MKTVTTWLSGKTQRRHWQKSISFNEDFSTKQVKKELNRVKAICENTSIPSELMRKQLTTLLLQCGAQQEYASNANLNVVMKVPARSIREHLKPSNWKGRSWRCGSVFQSTCLALVRLWNSNKGRISIPICLQMEWS